MLRPRVRGISDEELLNVALGAHGCGRWCLVVDPPARLEYANCDILPFGTLCAYLAERGATSLRAYPNSQTATDGPPWVDTLVHFERGMRIATSLTPGISDGVPIAMRAVIADASAEPTRRPFDASSQAEWDELADRIRRNGTV